MCNFWQKKYAKPLFLDVVAKKPPNTHKNTHIPFTNQGKSGQKKSKKDHLSAEKWSNYTPNHHILGQQRKLKTDYENAIELR